MVEHTVNEWIIAVPLIALIIVMAGHIVGMARWSGKVDSRLDLILEQPAKWTTDLSATAAALRLEFAAAVAALKIQMEANTAEVKTLREERHKADGTVARLEGAQNEINKTVQRIEERYDKIIDNGSGPVPATRN